MAIKSFERAALWTGAGFCGISAVCFAVNAGAALINHPENTGELYGMATAAAVFAFLTSRLREVIRDRQQRADALPPMYERAALPPSAPTWDAPLAANADPAAIRVERDCPCCAERILAAAKLCKHCHSDVSAS